MIRILHLHSGFDLGGKEARACKLMNHFGDEASHVILSAVPEAMGARVAIEGGGTQGVVSGARTGRPGGGCSVHAC